MRLTFKGKWRMVTKAGVEAQLEAVKILSHLIRNFWFGWNCLLWYLRRNFLISYQNILVWMKLEALTFVVQAWNDWGGEGKGCSQLYPHICGRLFLDLSLPSLLILWLALHLRLYSHLWSHLRLWSHLHLYWWSGGEGSEWRSLEVGVNSKGDSHRHRVCHEWGFTIISKYYHIHLISMQNWPTFRGQSS